MKDNSNVFLAIDDKIENLISIKALIKESFPGSTILTAQSGKEGLELAHEQEPDVILLDIMMPDMDGYEVCRIIKADPVLQDAPVIFVTALNSDRETRLKAIENGAEAFIHKPIDELELLVQLRTLLRLRKFNVQKKEKIVNLEGDLLVKINELTAREERFSIMVGSIADTIGITDVNGNVKFRSSNNEKLFGIKPEEVVGQNSFDFVHPDDKKRLESEFLGLIADGPGAKRTGEFKYLCKDGETVIVEIEGRNMLDNKLIDGVLLTFRDITEQKAAISKTEKESEKLRAMIDSIGDFAWIVEPDNFGLITFNDAMFQYYKKRIGIELHIGMRPEEMLPDKHLIPFWNSMYKRAMEQGAFKIDYEMSTSDTILNISFNLVKHNDIIIGISVFTQDITERKSYEKAILASNKNLNTIMNNSMFGAVTVGKDRKILWANPAAVTMMGLASLEEVIGKKCTEYFCPAQKDACPILDMGQVVDNSEKKIKCYDGHEIPIIKSVSEIEIDGESLLLETFIDISERKKMELALRESEERFRGIVSSMDDVVYTLDTEQRHTGVFGNWIKKNNLSEAFFLGKSASEIYGPELGKIHVAPTSKALNGENVVYEWDIINGSERNYYQTSLSPMYDPEGNIKGIVGIGRDITTIKKTEIDLVNSKDSFAKAQELGRFGHWSFNINTQKFIGSKVTFQIYGFDTLDTISYDEVVQCISKSDVDRITEKFNKLILEGGHFDEQFEIYPRGSELPLYIRNIADISQDENGLTILGGVIQDISDFKKLEQQNIVTSRQNQRILDNLQDAYLHTDLSGVLIIVNPKAADMYGFSSCAEMIGQPSSNLYDDEDDRKRMVDVLKEKGYLSDFISKGRRKDGTVFWASMNIQFVKDESGNIVGTEGMIRDITERIDMTNEIQLHRDWLIESNIKLTCMLEQSVNAISKIGELRDVYTAGHQRRVRDLACAIAGEMNFSDEDILNLSHGALIHDIGKIFIASDILNKPGKITSLEYQILQTHAEHGYNVVKEVDFPETISKMVYQHHERLDGSGYPQGLSGNQISIEARILAVSDVVEAMVSHRPYRAALGLDVAIEEIQKFKGIKYDTDVVDICVDLFNNGYILV